MLTKISFAIKCRTYVRRYGFLVTVFLFFGIATYCDEKLKFNQRTIFRISFNEKSSSNQKYERAHNISILWLPYTKYLSRSSNNSTFENLTQTCELDFFCWSISDLSPDLPKGSINSFSALFAQGPGHEKISKLYNELGGLTDYRPAKQFWISQQLESSMNPGNGNHLQGISHLFNWTVTMGKNGTFESNCRRGAQEAIKKCWFYLALENSNCTDYITEKFSNALISHAIPIVNSWKQNYDKLVPGSYIHVSDFSTGAELAAHISQTMNNSELFWSYHLWRQSYIVKDEVDNIEKLECSICKKLERETFGKFNRSYIVKDIKLFRKNSQKCMRF